MHYIGNPAVPGGEDGDDIEGVLDDADDGSLNVIIIRVGEQHDVLLKALRAFGEISDIAEAVQGNYPPTGNHHVEVAGREVPGYDLSSCFSKSNLETYMSESVIVQLLCDADDNVDDNDCDNKGVNKYL